jgi:hypothetical protein
MKNRLAVLFLAFSALAYGQSAGLTVVTVGSGATPTLTTTAGYTSFLWTLSTNVTSSTFSSAAVGAGSLVLCEDGTGGRTVVFPGNFVGFRAMQSTAANYCQNYTWEYDGTNVVATSFTGTHPTSDLSTATNTRITGCTFDGGGSTITTNAICYTRIPVAGTIIGWAIEAVGSSPACTIDVLKVATGTSLPTSSIAASALPALTSTDNAKKSTTLTGWTTSMAADDMVAFKVTVPGAATWAAVHVYYTVN